MNLVLFSGTSGATEGLVGTRDRDGVPLAE